MNSITKNQEAPIRHFKGPALIIAGPGAGKTLVVTERVKFLILEKSVDPKRILVTTFTEKAAQELKIKLAESVGRKAESIHISTIHSFCKTMLEKYHLDHNYGTDIDVLDDESQFLMLDLNKVRLGLASWVGGRQRNVKNAWRFTRKVQSLYNKFTENNINIGILLNELRESNELTSSDETIMLGYEKYLEMIENEHKLDFALLQALFFNLINSHKEILEDVRKSFDFFLVDEYQDTSPIQEKIFRALVGDEQNLFVVGDENQSIYGFRGASLKNFRLFTKHYPNAKEYFLNINFRSSENIVNFSNSVFESEVRKVLVAKRRKGEKIKLVHSDTADLAAKNAISLIKKLKNDGIISKYGDVALLFRSLKNHSAEYIKYLAKENIPFITYGDGQFVDRDDVKTVIYLMSYVTQELYIDNHFEKWSSWWKKDLFLGDFFNFSNSTKKAILQRRLNLYDLKNKEDFTKAGFTDNNDIDRLKKINRLKFDVQKDKDSFGSFQQGKNTLLIIFYKILEYSGYFIKMMNSTAIEAQESLHNLALLSTIIERYMEISKRDDVKSFLWYVYNASEDIDQKKLESEDTVKLMTVHQAKGLEFPVVFACCLNEGRFPLAYRDRSLVPIPYKFFDKENIENAREDFFQEERRLFYVAITRAQDNLILTSSTKIIVRGARRSRFLDAIPNKYFHSGEYKLSNEKKYRVTKKTPSLNYSAINTLIDCPLRYMLVYEYGFATPPSYMQKIGIFMHNALQRIHEYLRKNEEVTPDIMEEIADRCWLYLPMSEGKNNKLKEKKIQELITYYLSTKDSYKEVLAIEESFSHIDAHMIIKGKVDLIVRDKKGRVCLKDFKARKKGGIEKTNVDKQLKIYDYCLSDQYGINHLVAHTIEDNQETYFIPEKDNTRKFLEEISSKIASESYSKQENEFCRYCQFNFYCKEEK